MRSPQVFPISRVISPASRWFYLMLAVILAAPVAVAVVSVAAPGERRIELSAKGLDVPNGRFQHFLPVKSIEFDTVVRLGAHEYHDFRALTPLSGATQFQGMAGWFKRESGQKVLMCVTDWSKTVVVHTLDDDIVLVSPESPDAFVEAILKMESLPAGSAPQIFPIAERVGNNGAPVVTEEPFWIAWLAVPLLLLLVAQWIVICGRRLTFVVDEHDLRIRGLLYRRSIPLASLDLARAEVIHLGDSSKFDRMRRTTGYNLPGYSWGWFRPVGGGRALMFVTDRSRVVSIPTTSNYTLLVSPADANGFIEALQGRLVVGRMGHGQ